jgi:ribosomal-protein-alanine N-acetyltransferase
MLDAPATQCWLSRTQDGPRGLILVRAAGGDCEILTFGVDPACRRRGHGRMLMHAAAGWAVETGLERAVLEVAETNTAALELYRRLGFVRSGLRKRYYRTPGGSVDALVLAAPTSVLLNET